jgi:hypothetical protein
MNLGGTQNIQIISAFNKHYQLLTVRRIESQEETQLCVCVCEYTRVCVHSCMCVYECASVCTSEFVCV